MAAEAATRHNKQQTIAFTLPISCQICLGKVRSPVLCPNNHVFCSPCMDTWLQKNKQCPACRVSMTTTKKIIGGVSHYEEESNKMTNPELRKARFDLLYKEYENEFERMHSESQLLKTENQILKQQAKHAGSQDSRTSGEPGQGSRQADLNGLLVLTKKLQDATKLYEKLKGEMSHIKQENKNLKEENIGLNREVQHVRSELAGRSPHRYGRITVQTLESKVVGAEKDVVRLTKALERSDKYIEELEAELDTYRGKSSSSSKDYKSVSSKGGNYMPNGDYLPLRASSDSKVAPPGDYGSKGDNPSKRKLFTEEKSLSKSGSGESSKYYNLRNGYDKETDQRKDDLMDYESDRNYQKVESGKLNGASKGGKRVTFDLDKNTNATTSFDLEMPSPLKTSGNSSTLRGARAPSPVKSVLKNGKKNSGDTLLDAETTDMSKTLEDSLSNSYSAKSDRYSKSKDDDLVYSKSRTSSDRNYDDEFYSRPAKKYDADDSALSEPSDFNPRVSRSTDLDSRRTGELDQRRSEEPRRSSDINTRYSDTDYGKYNGIDARSSGSGLDKRSNAKSDDLDISDLDDTRYIENELDELNISLTPELSDCMKLLNRAEKNVNYRDPELDDLYGYKPDKGQGYSMDAEFRASTGGIRSSDEDFLSKYKPGMDRFASSMDSYSRGRHVRSGSLDNLLVDRKDDMNYRPSSALPTTSNMYSSTNTQKYSGGLTTGRTLLTKSPSLDNLLLTKPSGTHSGNYMSSSDHKSRLSFPESSSQRSYRGETRDMLDMKSGGGAVILDGYTGSSGAGRSLGGGSQGLSTDRGTDETKSNFDAVIQARTRSLADMGDTVTARTTHMVDYSKQLPPTGRATPTIPSTGASYDSIYSTGRAAPSHSGATPYTHPADKYLIVTTGVPGRATPTLTNTDTNPLTKSNPPFVGDYKSGPSSLPEMSQKPPIAGGQYDSRLPGTNHDYSSVLSSHANAIPAYTSSSVSSYASLPSQHGSGSTGDKGYSLSSKFETALASLPVKPHNDLDTVQISHPNNFDYQTDKLEIGARPRHRTQSLDDRYLASNGGGGSLPTYINNVDDRNYNYKGNNDYASKPPSLDTLPMSQTSRNIPPSSTANSGSTLPSFSGASSYGLAGSYPNISYLPTSLSSSTSSYSTARSVPMTYSTSSYAGSAPVNTYTTKPLDPITEASHFSYVSNMSADYSSKNDTFALPEPKKRLFDSTDDLDMSVSPIKSNRKY